VLGGQPIVQRRQIDAAIGVIRAPMRNRLAERLRFAYLQRTSVDGAGRHAKRVIAHSALAHAQKPCDLRFRNATIR
jgi:hypothetical protein